MCFPGCYCPPGFVRKDDNCIKPSSCRDCECNLLPHLQYVTYDENNFTITGNCVYVMSRDLLMPGEDKHKFQVITKTEYRTSHALIESNIPITTSFLLADFGNKIANVCCFVVHTFQIMPLTHLIEVI